MRLPLTKALNHRRGPTERAVRRSTIMHNVFAITLLLVPCPRHEGFEPRRLKRSALARHRNSSSSPRGSSPYFSPRWMGVALGLVAFALSLSGWWASKAAAEPPITPNSELTLQQATDIALKLH